MVCWLMSFIRDLSNSLIKKCSTEVINCIIIIQGGWGIMIMLIFHRNER